MMIIVTHLLYTEIPYLDEWISFHKAQGFTTFYIYIKYGNLTYGTFINKDEEIFNSLVQKYINTGVYFIHIDSVPMIHINHFFKHIAHSYIDQWCAILDIDEFIHSNKKGVSIKEITEEYNKRNINYVLVNWLCFGSNGVIDNPKYEVINKFKKPTNRFAGINFTGKSFLKITNQVINKDRVTNNTHRLMFGKYYTTKGILVSEQNKRHFRQLKKGRNVYLRGIRKKGMPVKLNFIYVYPEKEPNLIINHYITRSYNEYRRKISLNKTKKGRYNMRFFNYINRL